PRQSEPPPAVRGGVWGAPHTAPAAGEGGGRGRGGGEGRLPAVAHAHDADLPRPSVPALEGPALGVDEIVQHLAAPLAVAGQSMRGAVTGGPSKIDLQNRVAATGQPLDDRIPQP